jgi:hypothetical protein
MREKQAKRNRRCRSPSGFLIVCNSRRAKKGKIIMKFFSTTLIASQFLNDQEGPVPKHFC